jgi:hypothetical protein
MYYTFFLAILLTTVCACTPARSVPPSTFTADQIDPWKHPAVPRLVAIGDVHGDRQAAQKALELAGAVDQQGNWQGGKLVVVQVGDQLDRGDDERAILDWFESLRYQANKAGGGFFPLLGNHETMNVLLDLRYVTKKGFEEFSEFADLAEGDPQLTELKPHELGRGAAFRQGGPYAKILSRHLAIVQVGPTIFVHGGVLPKHVEYGIGRMNKEIRQWMGTKSTEVPEFVNADDSPFWTRRYSHNTNSKDCKVLSKVLKKLGASRMVVAHTPQSSGINSKCGGQVWRVDTGLSAHYGGPTEVLEIVGDELKVLRD